MHVRAMHVYTGITLLTGLGCAPARPDEKSATNVDQKAVDLLNAMEQRLLSAKTAQASGVSESYGPTGQVEMRQWARVRFVAPEHTLIVTDSTGSLRAGGNLKIEAGSMQGLDGK